VKVKAVLLFFVLLLVCVASMAPLSSAQSSGAIADMYESWNYRTWEDDINDISLECHETYWWNIRNYIGEPIVNPVITAETDLEFFPSTEPYLMGPPIYEWRCDSVPVNRWWSGGGSSKDPVSVTSGFRVERHVFPEKIASFPAVQVVNVTLWVQDTIPDDANELSVTIGFYPIVWQEDVLLNYNLISWSNDAGWSEYQQGPSAIQFYTFRPFTTGVFNFTATFEVTKIPSLMGSPVSKPMVEVFWRKVLVEELAEPSTSVSVECPNRWTATIQLEQEVNWTLITTELPALFADMSSISSPILYDSEDNPRVLDELKFTLASGADLHVYDATDRHVGLNYETGELEIQISGATFVWSGDTQIVTVPDPMAGNYTTRLVGTSETWSTYELLIEALSETEVLYTETHEDTISKEQTHECTTTIPYVGEEINTELLPNTVFDVVWEGFHYPITIFSSSSVTHFIFNQTLAQISFDVTGESVTNGYCNVTIPNNLLWGNFTVLIDGDPPVELIRKDNATHASIYFTYELQITRNVQIIGTEVIPEFPFFPILPLFMTITLLAAILYRRQLRNGNVGQSCKLARACLVGLKFNPPHTTTLSNSYSLLLSY
jgi:hypothetical protein